MARGSVVDELVLRELFANSDYFFSVFTHLEKNMFDDLTHRTIFNEMHKFYSENGACPTFTDIKLAVSELKNSENYIQELDRIKSLPDEGDKDFLVSKTEKWMKNKKIKEAVLSAAECLDNNKDTEYLLEDINTAFSISLDKDLGYSDTEIDRRFEAYQKTSQASITTGIQSLDDKLGGGFLEKTLNVVAAVTHGGKSLMLSHICAHNLKQGKKGVYITLEMSETEIWKRIDANILGVSTANLATYSPDTAKAVYSKIGGKLYIKEYGSCTMNVNDIRTYIRDLKLEKDFIPDYICVDYLTIMASTRYKNGAVPPYLYFKFIAEELHGFAKEIGVPIITAAQLNRGAFGNLNSSIQDVADSIGISQTADTFFTLNKEEGQDNHIYVNIAKNRNSGVLTNFVIGVDYTTLSFYDIEEGNIKIAEEAGISWVTDNKPVVNSNSAQSSSLLNTKENDDDWVWDN